MYQNPEVAGQAHEVAVHRIDEQLAKAMDRKVWLPSGGTLVIDRTEAMTVVESLVESWDDALADRWFAPNVDLDRPRAEGVRIAQPQPLVGQLVFLDAWCFGKCRRRQKGGRDLGACASVRPLVAQGFVLYATCVCTGRPPAGGTN